MMKLKIELKQLVIASAMAIGVTSYAQTASFYGLIDVGVESIQNVATVQVPTPGGTTSNLTRVPTNTNTAPSRLGVRGSRDIGDGMSVIYTAEAGIDAGNGQLNQGGRFLGRQIFAGLKGSAGTLSIGRQYTMTFWSGLNADIHGGGIYGTGSLDSYLPNARADNSVVWMGKFGDWSLGANYSLGRDTAIATPANPAATNCAGESTDASACRQYSALAKYDTPTWGAAFSTDTIKGGTAATFGGLANSGLSDTRNVLNGWVKLGTTKIGGGLISRSNDGTAQSPKGAKSNLWHIGASMPVTPKLTLSAQYLTLRYQQSAAYNSQLLALRGTYALFKDVDVYVQVASIQNEAKASLSVSGGAPLSSPLTGEGQQAINAGIRIAF
jgi:predicted porin